MRAQRPRRRKTYYYDCRACKNWVLRPNGRYGCSIIDHSQGIKYPISVVNRVDSPLRGKMVCKYYDVERPDDIPYKRAVKKNIYSVIKMCSACGNLVHQAAEFCPKCFADFEDTNDE